MPQKPDDLELVRRSREGDTEAFARPVELHRDAVYATARRGRGEYLPPQARRGTGTLRQGDAAVWGIALVVVGLLAFLRVMGVRWFPTLWRFWPLLLVAAGTYLIAQACRFAR